jgi:hypothetical protein
MLLWIGGPFLKGKLMFQSAVFRGIPFLDKKKTMSFETIVFCQMIMG